MKILDIPRSGSIAGTTSSHNRAGQYVRNRRTPTNTPTPNRTAIRTAFGASSSAYSALTASEQLAWAAAADAHPITDALGQSIKLTGHQLYVSLSTQLINCQSTPNLLPPSDFSVFSAVPASAVFSVATGLVITESGAGTVDDFLLIAVSRPVPAGRTFWKTFTQIDVDPGNSATHTITTATYGAQFGTPAIGQKVFIRLTPVSAAGVTGVAATLVVVVTA